MHLKEPLLPPMVLDLPLARHATAGMVAVLAVVLLQRIFARAAKEEKLEALS